MKNNFKRCLALLLALMTIVGAFSIPVSAAEPCDHDWEEYKTVKATCTTVGYATYVCKLCSESKTEILEAKLNHTWVEMTVEKDSNCTNPGYRAGAEVCSVCNTVKDEADIIDPKTNPELKDHVWDESKTRYDGELCDANGVVTTYKTCSLCKQEFVYKTETNAAGAGHDYKYTIVTEATCTADGKALATCKTCGDKYEIKIAKLDHPGSTEWMPSNKTAKNSAGTEITVTVNQCIEVKKCTECGVVTDARAVGAHVWEYTSNFTSVCQAPGYRMRKCKTCQFVNKEEFLLTHQFNTADPIERVEGVHKADKLVEGYSVYKCLKCDENVKVVESYEGADNFHTPGHDDSLLTLDQTNAGFWVEPTCTEQGYGRYNCTCGYSVVAPIKATGHSWTKYEAGTTGYKIITGVKHATKNESASCKDPYKVEAKCDNCDFTETKIFYPAATNHETNEALVGDAYDVKGTCFKEGFKVYGCNTCKKEVSRKTGAAAGNAYKKTNHGAAKLIVYSNGSTGCFVERKEWKVCMTCADDAFDTYAEVAAAVTAGTLKEEDAFGVDYTSTLHRNHDYAALEVIEKPTCHTTGAEGYKCKRTFKDVEGNTKKADVKCDAKEIQNILDFDKTNHTGGKSLDTTKGYYDVANQKGKLEVGKLTNISSIKNDPNVKDDFDCYELSYTWWYCEGCDKEFTEVTTKVVGTGKNAVTYYSGDRNHIWGAATFAETGEKDSTCTENGLGRRTCTVCGDVEKNYVIPAKGHNIENKIPANASVPAVPSDCKNYGYAFYKCENCGISIRVDETELSTTHAYGAWSVVTNPTCTAKGQDKRTCSICGKVETRESNKVAHGTMPVKVEGVDKYFDVVAAKPAECGVAGWATFNKCLKCSTYYVGAAELGKDLAVAKTKTEVKEAALEHDANDLKAEIDATCTTYGYDQYNCSKCKIEREWKNFTDKLEHTPVLDTNGKPVVSKKPATCYAYAYSYYTCDREVDPTTGAKCGAEFEIVEDRSQVKPPHVNNKTGYPLTGDCRVILGDENCKACAGTGVLKANLDAAIIAAYDADADGKCDKCIDAYTCTNKKTDGTTLCGAEVPAQCDYVNPVKYDACNAIVSTCKFCGDKDNAKIDANKEFTHTYEITVAPTTTTEGEEACKVCGYVNPTPVARIPAVTFSMNAYNPNGGDIVNGGLVYVDVMMKTAEAIDVNNIRVAINFKDTHLVFSGIVGNESVFGNVSSEPVANDQDGVVYVFDDAGKERFNITLDGEMKFVTLAFYVKPNVGVNNDGVVKDRVPSELEFTAVVPANYAPSVSYYDSIKGAYSDYSFDITTNAKIDLAINQLGDIDNNGKVNNYDLVAVRDAMTDGAEYDAVLDIDHDGEITIKDYKLIKEFMVAKYDYWQFADIDSFNSFVEYANKKDKPINVTNYITWLETEKA